MPMNAGLSMSTGTLFLIILCLHIDGVTAVLPSYDNIPRGHEVEACAGLWAGAAKQPPPPSIFERVDARGHEPLLLGAGGRLADR